MALISQWLFQFRIIYLVITQILSFCFAPNTCLVIIAILYLFSNWFSGSLRLFSRHPNIKTATLANKHMFKFNFRGDRIRKWANLNHSPITLRLPVSNRIRNYIIENTTQGRNALKNPSKQIWKQNVKPTWITVIYWIFCYTSYVIDINQLIYLFICCALSVAYNSFCECPLSVIVKGFFSSFFQTFLEAFYFCDESLWNTTLKNSAAH